MYAIKRITGDYDVTKMIEGNDIYNSLYIRCLDSLECVGSYSTPYYSGRMDIILRCIYDTAPVTYASAISVYNRLFLDNSTCMVDICYPLSKCIQMLSID